MPHATLGIRCPTLVFFSLVNFISKQTELCQGEVLGESPLALFACASRHSVACTPEDPGDEWLITVDHCSCCYSLVCRYFILYYWAFKWRWHPLYLTCHAHWHCSKMHNICNVMHTHTFLHICSGSYSLLAHDNANSIFDWWCFVSVCMVSVWHLAERYACAAWHYDSLDILDLNVVHAVLHHNMSP